MRKLLILAMLLVVASAAGQTTSFYTDRAVGTFPVGSGSAKITSLIPIQFGPVRVCSLPLTQQQPCLPLATITDINGNLISNSIGGGFGQISTDVVGRFTFGCQVNLNYQVQVAPASSNVPQLNYPITCPGTGATPSFTVVTACSFNGVISPVLGCSTYPGTWAGIVAAAAQLVTNGGGFLDTRGLTGSAITATSALTLGCSGGCAVTWFTGQENYAMGSNTITINRGSAIVGPVLQTLAQFTWTGDVDGIKTPVGSTGGHILIQGVSLTNLNLATAANAVIHLNDCNSCVVRDVSISYDSSAASAGIAVQAVTSNSGFGTWGGSIERVNIQRGAGLGRRGTGMIDIDFRGSAPPTTNGDVSKWTIWDSHLEGGDVLWQIFCGSSNRLIGGDMLNGAPSWNITGSGACTSANNTIDGFISGAGVAGSKAYAFDLNSHANVFRGGLSQNLVASTDAAGDNTLQQSVNGGSIQNLGANGTCGAPTWGFASRPVSDGLVEDSSNGLAFCTGGVEVSTYGSAGHVLASGQGECFNTGALGGGGATPDVCFKRSGTNTVNVTNGAAGNGILQANTLINTTLVGASNGNTVTLLNVQGPSGAITGTGAAATLFTYTLPGNTLRIGTCFEVTVGASHSSGTASVTYIVSYGGTTLASNANTATGQGVTTIELCDIGATNTQKGMVTGALGVFSNNLTNPASAIDSTVNQTILVTFNVPNTDQVTPEYFRVRSVQ